MNKIQYTRNSLVFDVFEAGVKNKETIVLLHGFPASAPSLKPVGELLAAKGYSVLIPKQRGYSRDARPRSRRDYKLSELVEDIVALLDAQDIQFAHIVGHDWGGVVAWAFAAKYPERTLSLTAISTPHPRALLASILKSKQLFLSWYMLFFQLPGLPELIIRKNLRKVLVYSGLSSKIATTYARAMQDDRDLLKGGLNWYRALPFTLPEARKIGKIVPKTLFMYGKKDIFLSETAAARTEQWVSGQYSFICHLESTHWIPEESPEWLADKIVEFIK